MHLATSHNHIYALFNAATKKIETNEKQLECCRNNNELDKKKWTNESTKKVEILHIKNANNTTRTAFRPIDSMRFSSFFFSSRLASNDQHIY